MTQNIFLQMNTGLHTAACHSLFATSDGSRIVSFSEKTIRIWDPISQKEVGQFRSQTGHADEGRIKAINISPNDRYLVASVRRIAGTPLSDHIRIFDFETQKLLKTYDHGGGNQAVEFSPDGRYLLLSNFGQQQVEIYDFEKFLQNPGQEALVHSFYSGQGMRAKIYKYGDDYRILVSRWGSVGSFLIYSLNNKEEIKTIYPDPSGNPEDITLSDRYIAFCYESRGGYRIECIEHSLADDSRISIETPNGKAIRFSPDGRYLLAGFRGFDGACSIYDAENNFKLLSRLDYYDSAVSGTAFLNKRTAVTCGGNRNELVLWDPQTGGIRGKIEGLGSAVYAVGIDRSEGFKIAFGLTQHYTKDENNYAPLEKVFDLETFTLEDIGEFDLDRFERAKIDRDGMTLHYDKDNDRWDKSLLASRDGNVLGLRAPYAQSFGISDNGVVITGEYRDGRLYAYKPEFDDDHAFYEGLAWFKGHSGDVWDLATAGNILISCGSDQTIRLWNLDELDREEDVNGGWGVNARMIEPILNLFIANDGEWVVWSKSGFYNSSLNGDQYIGFHVNRGIENGADFYPCSRFVNTLFRPDVVNDILALGSEEKALAKWGLEDIDVESILPPAVTLGESQELFVDKETTDLTIQVTNESQYPLAKVWMLIDGYPEWEWTPEKGEAPADIDGVQTFTAQVISLLAGGNKIEIFAKTAVSQSNPLEFIIQASYQIEEGGSRAVSEGGKNKKKTTSARRKKVDPNLYVLTVGVSRYQHGKVRKKNSPAGQIYHLNYPHIDAQEISKQLKTLAADTDTFRSFKKVEIIDTLSNAKATKPSILSAAKKLKKKVDDRYKQKQADGEWARDVVVVFFAGHGYQRTEEIEVQEGGNGELTKKKVRRFYFFGYDTDPTDIPNTAVNIIELGEIINSLKAEVILLLDACHAGRVGINFNNDELTKRWGEINSRAQIVFSATLAGRVAVEHSAWGHGAFTKGLIEVLKVKETTSILQFFPQVSDYVSNLTRPTPREQLKPGEVNKTRRMQRPTLSILGSLSDYDFKKLKG